MAAKSERDEQKTHLSPWRRMPQIGNHDLQYTIYRMRLTTWKVAWFAGTSFIAFVSAWTVPPIINWHHQRYSLPSITGCDDDVNDWEEEARNTATGILHQVFVPDNTTKLERAVKAALRSLDVDKLRHRVSQLAIGTFIMRKRHEYLYNRRGETERLKCEDMTRYLVDLHAAYLDSNGTHASNTTTWPNDPVDRIAVQYSMPHFLVQAWISKYGINETELLCDVANKPGPITLRRNAIRCRSDDFLVERLAAEEGITLSSPTLSMPGCLRIASDRPRSIWAMSAWKDGWFEVQDVGSQLIVAAMELDKDDGLLIDYCAGNGGKTLAMISQLYELSSSATVWAHDVQELRLAQLRGSLSRAGAANTSIRLLTTSCASQDFYRDMADVVLVDVPCSSCGVLRRRPSHRWELTQEAVEVDLPTLQTEILQNASLLVKPGGRLVYATCSLCHCENEAVASKVESELSTSWEPWQFEDSWPVINQNTLAGHYCNLLPHKHDSDGFFIARWKRTQ